MKEVARYRRKNFGRLALPVSASLLVGIGVLFTILIFLEEGWSWHVPIPLPICALCGAIVHLIYREGNEIIEIAPDKISVIAGGHPTKTILYSEIEVLKYTYVPGYMLPSIELRDKNCKIDFDAEMREYPIAVGTLFDNLIEKGREDLIKSYKEQFEKTSGVKT